MGRLSYSFACADDLSANRHNVTNEIHQPVDVDWVSDLTHTCTSKFHATCLLEERGRRLTSLDDAYVNVLFKKRLND